MKLTYYGHSCFGLEIGGMNILFDPFISPNPLAKDIDVDAVPADVILVSHGHEDHIADVVRIAKRTNAKVVSNFEIIQWLEKKGVQKGHPMNIGGVFEQQGVQMKSVNAVHSSSMPDGSYGGIAGGWLIQGEGLCIYYAGDTALHIDMKLIAMHQPTHAIVPIGDNFTMGIEDAVTCSDMIKCDNIIGMHYDTFPMIQINHELAINEFDRVGKKLTLMPIGSSIELK